MPFFYLVCQLHRIHISMAKYGILWRFLYLVGQLENREKPIDNISRGWYTENVQKIY